MVCILCNLLFAMEEAEMGLVCELLEYESLRFAVVPNIL